MNMTLILTELSRFGIAMAADSAVTFQETLPEGDTIPRVLLGVRKLQPIPKLNAGISVWGLGEIEEISTDIWLANIIRTKEEEYNSINEFAILLQNELRRHIPDIDVSRPENQLGTIGFHLAGFVEWEEQSTPTFYHIHNGISQDPSRRGISIYPRKVNASHDLPPQLAREHIDHGVWYITRNGDYQLYANLFGYLGNFFLGLAEQTEIVIPYSISLEDRAKWLKFQIKMMADLYAFSNRGSVIGGDVATLTISSQGIESYDGGKLSNIF